MLNTATKKLETVERIFTMMNEDTVSKEQFVNAFERVVELILKVQKQQADAIDALERTYKNLLEKVRMDHTESLSSLKGGVNKLFVEDKINEIHTGIKSTMSEMHMAVNKIVDQKLKEVDTRMARVKDGSVGAMGPRGFVGQTGSVDQSVIVSLRKEIETLKKLPRGRMGMRKVPIIRAIDFSGDVNGSATTFTLPRDVVRVLLAWSTQFPIVLRPDTDFTVAGQTLTLVSTQVGPIQSGQTLTCLIETLFYA